MIGAGVAARVAAAALAATLVACGDQSTFALGRDLEICEGNLPTACTRTARCVLDPHHYIEGRFPGARRFVVRSEGEADLRVGVLLTEQRAPGTLLELTAYEPGCGDRVSWDSAGRDLFRLAGADGVLLITLHVRRPGDHLFELVADSYCRYALKLNP